MVFSVRQDSESRAGPSRAAAARRRGRGRVARRVNQELTENLHGVNIGSLTHPPGPRRHRGSGAEHFSLHRGGESCRQHVATIPHLRVARIPRGRVRGGGRADQHFRTHRGRGPGSPARHRTTGTAAASRHRRSTLMTRAGDAGPPRRENFCRIHKTPRMSPSMAAGVTGERRDVRRIPGLAIAVLVTWDFMSDYGTKIAVLNSAKRECQDLETRVAATLAGRRLYRGHRLQYPGTEQGTLQETRAGDHPHGRPGEGE